MTRCPDGGPMRTPERATHRPAAHWLLVGNLANAAVLGEAALAPLLRAWGWEPLATLVYLALRPLCLQRPDHSFFLFGYPLAREQRMLAIFGGLLLGGLRYAPLRDRLRPLGRRPLQTSPHDVVHILVPRVARNPPGLADSWAL